MVATFTRAFLPANTRAYRPMTPAPASGESNATLSVMVEFSAATISTQATFALPSMPLTRMVARSVAPALVASTVRPSRAPPTSSR